MRYIIVLLAITLGAMSLSSCGTYSSSQAYFDFRTGFKDGWNSTVPDNYRMNW